MNLRVFYLTRRGLSDGYAYPTQALSKYRTTNAPFYGATNPFKQVRHKSNLTYSHIYRVFPPALSLQTPGRSVLQYPPCRAHSPCTKPNGNYI